MAQIQVGDIVRFYSDFGYTRGEYAPYPETPRLRIGQITWVNEVRVGVVIVSERGVTGWDVLNRDTISRVDLPSQGKTEKRENHDESSGTR